jgi:alpha-beta hydrolase superfamily lysophospholipase
VTADVRAFADDPAAFFSGSPTAMHTLPVEELVTLQRLALRHRFAELRDRVPVLWTTYALSLRGHGRSPGAVRGATLNEYVDDVASAAEETGGRPVLIGHSMGGLVVDLALTRVPARAAVLVAPAPDAGIRWFPGLGHDLMLEARTGRVVDALVAWLGSHVMADDGSANGE